MAPDMIRRGGAVIDGPDSNVPAPANASGATPVAGAGVTAQATRRAASQSGQFAAMPVPRAQGGAWARAACQGDNSGWPHCGQQVVMTANTRATAVTVTGAAGRLALRAVTAAPWAAYRP